MDLYRTLDLKFNPVDGSHFEINFKRTINCPTTRLIWMSVVSGGLTGIIIALWRTLLNNGEIIMRISHLLSHNITSQGNDRLMPARMKANGNFNDASVERFDSVRINRMMSPSDAVDMESPLQQPIWISGGSPIRFHSGVVLSKIV